jgi:hypothetical protein
MILSIIFLYFLYKLLIFKNYIASALLIPYILLFIFYLAPEIYQEIGGNGERELIVIEEMLRVKEITKEELLGISFNSGVTISSPFQYSGGIIHNINDRHSDLVKLLKSNGINIPQNKSMIWLMNSKATRLKIQGRLLFISDQKEAESGVWVGWIDKEKASKIKSMDGNPV